MVKNNLIRDLDTLGVQEEIDMHFMIMNYYVNIDLTEEGERQIALEWNDKHKIKIHKIDGNVFVTYRELPITIFEMDLYIDITFSDKSTFSIRRTPKHQIELNYTFPHGLPFNRDVPRLISIDSSESIISRVLALYEKHL